MKKFTKVCLIISGVFVVLGLLGVTAGIALGARPKQFLNLAYDFGDGIPWHRGRALAEDIWEERLEDFTGEEAGQEEEVRIDRENFSGTDVWEEHFGGNGIQKIDMEFHRAVVDIYLHEEEDILVKAWNRGNYFECREEGEELKLKDERPRRRHGREEDPLVLEIYLPQKGFAELDLDLGAGEVTAERLEAGQVSISLGAGIMDVAELITGHEADLECGTGEFYVNYFDGGSMDLKCGVGVLNVLAEGSAQDYNYEITGGMGSISIDGEDYSGMGFENRRDNGALKDVSVECGIGEVNLDFME